jgi:hypothetical protein
MRERVVPESGFDRALQRRFLAERDEDALAGLVSRHASLVIGVFRRILGNAEDAEDVFQVTFIVLSKKVASIHELRGGVRGEEVRRFGLQPLRKSPCG